MFWYTDFGGPVTEQEIQQWRQTMQANGARADRIAYYETFLREDTGRQFFMLNAIDLSTSPPQVSGAKPNASADELMAHYLEHMLVELLSKACHPIILGAAPFTAIDLVGIDGAESWDQGAVFRYRSRRAFMQVISNPVTLARHEFKTAALEKTIAYPIETNFYLADLRLLLGIFLLAFTALIDARLRSRRR